MTNPTSEEWYLSAEVETGEQVMTCPVSGREFRVARWAERDGRVRALEKTPVKAVATDGGRPAEDGRGDKHVLAETQVAGFGTASGKVVERLLIEFDRETPAAKLVHDRLDYAGPFRDRDPNLETLAEIVANPHDSHRDGEQKLETGSGYGKDRVIVDYHEHAPRVYIRHEHFDNGEWSEAAAWELHPATGVEEVGGELLTDGGQTLEEQKESHRLGTINRWDAPEADWAADYDWTRYRGPQPYPAPEDWVLDEPEGGIVGWQHFPDVGTGHGLLDDVYDELEGDYDDWGAYEDAVEEARGVRAFLSNDIVEDGRDMDVILEQELSIAGDTVFRRVDPSDDELWARTAEALARYADGESVEEFADDIGFQSGRLPDDLQEERENERCREENAGLDEFATDGGQPAEDGRSTQQKSGKLPSLPWCSDCWDQAAEGTQHDLDGELPEECQNCGSNRVFWI